jgi:hypothetical protein
MKLLYIAIIILIFLYLKKSKEDFDSIDNRNFRVFDDDMSYIKNREPITIDHSTEIVKGFDNNYKNYQDITQTDINLTDNTNIIVSNGDFPKEVIDDNNKFNLLGIAYNVYYNMYYIIYEREFTDSTKLENKDFTEDENKKVEINENFNSIYGDIYVKPPLVPVNETKFLINKIYEYVLVKMENKLPKIMHRVGPRKKINLNDIVYLSYGSFELGPLTIKEIKKN